MSYNNLNPLKKEFLIKQYKRNHNVKLSDFCAANGVSDAAFRTWFKRYDAEGITGLYRTKRTPTLLPHRHHHRYARAGVASYGRHPHAHLCAVAFGISGAGFGLGAHARRHIVGIIIRSDITQYSMREHLNRFAEAAVRS